MSAPRNRAGGKGDVYFAGNLLELGRVREIGGVCLE
jgi:hypothetical protein